MSNNFTHARGAGVNFNVDMEIVERCGCPECSTSIQPGHLYCETITDAMASLEKKNVVIRAYDDGAWQWFLVGGLPRQFR